MDNASVIKEMSGKNIPVIDSTRITYFNNLDRKI